MDCEWNAVVRYCLILKILASLFTNALQKFIPLSVKTALGAPWTQMNLLTKARAIVLAFPSGKGIATKNFVKRSCSVRITTLLFHVGGNGPTMSMAILSKGLWGVSVITIGCFVFTRTNFFSWHRKQ